MKLKIIFFCVLCLITLVLSQFEITYSIDLGTDYVSGVMNTKQSYSSTSVTVTRFIFINVLGWLIIITEFILALFLYIKLGKLSFLEACGYIFLVFAYSLTLVFFSTITRVFDNGFHIMIWILVHFALISVVFLFATNMGMNLAELIIVSVVLFVFYAMAQPNVHKSRAPARQKTCYSNIRVINSAVEMYNMDADGKHMMDELDISKLVSASYLKAAPTCPETGVSKSYVGSNLKTTGQIHCLYKGGEYPELEHGYLDMSDPDTKSKSEPKVYTLTDFFDFIFKRLKQ